MEVFIQGFVMAFREGLEALLIVMILLKFLEKTKHDYLKKNLWLGLYTGIGASFIFGLLLKVISVSLGGMGTAAKLWESLASLVAVMLIVTFIIWMINHGAEIKEHIEGEAALNLSPKGIFLLAAFMVIREGAEIVLFQFAGRYSTSSVIAGLVLSIILTVALYYSLVSIKLKTIFSITLAYLVLQAGFLLGYSVHEALSASKELGMIAAESPIFTQAFNLSETVFYHKEGIVGIPLYVAFGWYSKPEWIQFVLQYGLTFSLFGYWYQRNQREKAKVLEI